MELKDILVVALSTLIVLMIAHVAVFWIVRTLYPPVVAPVVPPPVFTPAPIIQEPQQNVTIPTYETPIPVEAPREEEPRRGPPPPEATSIHGKSGVGSVDAQ